MKGALRWLVLAAPAACGAEPPQERSVAPLPAAGNGVSDWTPQLLKRRETFDPARFWAHIQAPIVLDPQAGLAQLPDWDKPRAWAEHPRGEYRVRTNNLGLLEDGVTAPEKSGLRILVAGDSHLTVVSPSESFPELLERRLRAAGLADCEVLNAGVPYTGPRLYLQRLQKFLYLAPDVFVEALFTGNDFWDDLLLEYDIPASPPPLLDAGYVARLELAKKRFEGALYQGLNQAHWFKHWPGTAEFALQKTLATLEETRDFCAQHGILFAVLCVPTRVDVDRTDRPRERAAALAALGLSEEEAGIQARLATRLAEALATWGVPCADPSAAMRADPRPFFWRKDHHLGLTGHAFLADTLFALLEPELVSHGWLSGR